MLLRSSSTPILNSWIPPHYNHYSCTSKDSSPSHDHNTTHHELNFPNEFPGTKSTSTLSHHENHHHPSKPAIMRTVSETHHWDPQPPLTTPSTPLQRLFFSSGLDETVSKDSEEGRGISTGSSESNSSNYRGHGSMETYYKSMIELSPGNSLLLGNYAKFLIQVHGDLARAEEYCERAILASPTDANVLSLYAEIVWQSQRDAQRAQTYFDRAVESAPQDCYVLASYAKFLWDVEEEEEEEEEEEAR